MKKSLLLLTLLTLASCNSAPVEQDGWGKWSDPNYISNKYQAPEVVRTEGTLPLTLNTGWTRR